jgi:hypothetical protein
VDLVKRLEFDQVGPTNSFVDSLYTTPPFRLSHCFSFDFHVKKCGKSGYKMCLADGSC